MAKIVIIENNRIIARDLAEILQGQRHEVLGIAGAFDEAIDLVEERKPDLVLIDIHLNGPRDGIAVASELREEFAVAIAFLTSHSDEATVSKTAILRPNGYLIKPFDESSVNVLVKTALANFSASDHTLATDQIALLESGKKRALSLAHQLNIEDYISKHFDGSIRVAELAALCDLSEAEFSRQFQAAYGISPTKHIVAQRLNEAKRLLRNTDWPIVEIAHAVGFGNQSHFTTSFRKALGTTPAAYRRFSR